MSEEAFQSEAFEHAELRSERLRILVLQGFMAVFIGVTVIRVFVIRTVTDTRSWMWSLFLALAVIAYEAWMLRKVSLALRSNQTLSAQFWFLSTVVETTIPALAMAFLTSNQ